MLKCKDVVKIVSTEERRSWRHRIGVRLHLMMCHHCSKYAKQLDILRSSFRTLFAEKRKATDERKIKDLERRIILKIK